MSRYVDASAVVRLYVEESDSPLASELLDAPWASARHTVVEVRRALTQTLEGDEQICQRAAELSETTGARTLDALHLAVAERAGAHTIEIVTFDRRLADVARSLGWTVLGA